MFSILQIYIAGRVLLLNSRCFLLKPRSRDVAVGVGGSAAINRHCHRDSSESGPCFGRARANITSRKHAGNCTS